MQGLSWRGRGLVCPLGLVITTVLWCIDDDRVVDVVVDDIVWRRRNVFRRVDPDRTEHNRNGRYMHTPAVVAEPNPRSDRSCGRKNTEARRRLKSEIRIVENQHRSFDVNHLFRRGGAHRS